MALLLTLACQLNPGTERGGGAGAASSSWPCQGTVYVRVRNVSEFDFGSVEVDGIKFGALRRGSLSEYHPAAGCESLMGMKATSGGQIFSSIPIDQLAPPLAPGYYTSELTAEAGEYSSGSLNSKLVSP